MITISLCLIVKNEEYSLEQCLASVHGIPDEIIIVDTGSTDHTKEMAAKWTSHVYDFAWIDDFSAARNASFQYATKDYILWLDADDILQPEERTKLLQLKHTLPEEVDALSMIYEVPHGDGTGNVSRTMRLRLVKREAGFEWRGFVHEDLALDTPFRLMKTDITVTHTNKHISGPDTLPSRRNLDIYEKHLAKGHTLNVSDAFHYASECHNQKLYDKAIPYYELCRKHPDISVENKVFILHRLATCYVLSGQPEKELELTLESLTLDVPYPAFSCRMAEHLLQKGQIEAAIYWYQTAYMNPVNERYAWSIVDSAFHTWVPHQQLAECYKAIGDLKQAAFHRERAEFYRKQP